MPNGIVLPFQYDILILKPAFPTASLDPRFVNSKRQSIVICEQNYIFLHQIFKTLVCRVPEPIKNNNNNETAETDVNNYRLKKRCTHACSVHIQVQTIFIVRSIWRWAIASVVDLQNLFFLNVPLLSVSGL